MRTYSVKEKDIVRKWYVLDAAGRPMGRLASEAAAILRGKHKPMFTPNLDTGDHVIVINAERAILTGRKGKEEIHWHTGWPGGLRSIARAKEQTEKPDRALYRVIKGMLPHNRLGAKMIKKLKIYAGPTHPHTAQTPELWTRSLDVMGQHSRNKKVAAEE
ncbi:MAG: 50S ribosomal protein L13 [Armatimonadetes bacterium]|nr:50S ribosomal protein L13 [Armatimonadota bacterium]